MILFNLKVLLRMLIALLLFVNGATQAATPTSWKETGFSLNANGMSLRQVLNEFGAVYGVRPSISVNGDARVQGRLKSENGTEFLDKLALTYKFRWFVYNETLYVVPISDNASLRLQIGEDAVQDSKAALIGLGLFDTRFGWGELPDEGVVIVSGPREYVNLVRDVLLPEGKKAAIQGRQIMIFRLKYASATDRTINVRGESTTIPGVKTILNNLLNGPNSPAKLGSGNVSATDFDMSSAKRSRQGIVGPGSAREVQGSQRLANSSSRPQQSDDAQDGDRKSKSKSSAKDENPRIEADPSLNALIVYDNVSKREMYQGLIAELDIEPQQIEIEALIVDIDRTKLRDMGVEWSFQSGNTTTTINGTAGNSQGTDLPIPGSTLLIRNAARFYARLRAMEQTGEVRVLAKPTVLTLENVAAVLDLSQTVYLPLVGERVTDLANVTAGTMLKVVPRLVREGNNTRVRLDVDIEDGAIGSEAKTNVSRSTISTQAIIDLQQTLMIGGYHSESLNDSLQKVPLLGDVPIFGGLFRSNSESVRNRERLFLITPRMSGSSGIPAKQRSHAAYLARSLVTASKLTPMVSQGTVTVSESRKPVLPIRLQLSPSLVCDKCD